MAGFELALCITKRNQASPHLIELQGIHTMQSRLRVNQMLLKIVTSRAQNLTAWAIKLEKSHCANFFFPVGLLMVPQGNVNFSLKLLMTKSVSSK